MEEVLTKTLFVYGLAIVVSMAIAAVIKLIVVVLNALERKPTVATPAVPVAAPTFDIAADHVAAIAAAVYATLGSARILHIEPSHRGSEWLVEGRLAQHGSHITHHTAR
jgi:hypothetical protein